MGRGKTEWGLYAKFVERVVPADRASDVSPFDIARALGLARDDSPWPVIMLAANGHTHPFLAFGKLAFRQVDLDLVQPVPKMVRDPAKAQLVSGIVMGESGPPLLVLDTAL